MELHEAIKKSFDFLEETYSPKWRGGKGSKDNLIKAFSQSDELVHIAAGYKGGDGIRHAMYRAMPSLNKPKTMHWRTWLLESIGLYYCNKCNTCVELDQKSNGRCKSCCNTKSNNRRHNNRANLLQFLADKACLDCGESDPIVLEFDHIDPSTKVNNISNMMSHSWTKIKEEIDKCEVVCANCHRKRTAKQFNWYKDVL